MKEFQKPLLEKLELALDVISTSECPTYYVPAATNVTFLQHAAFDREGARIVAVLNFWQKGEAFFTLRAKGLADGDYAVVDEKGVLYANAGGGRTWTAAELQRLYRARREELRKAADEDRRDTERNPPPCRDYMPVI